MLCIRSLSRYWVYASKQSKVALKPGGTCHTPSERLPGMTNKLKCSWTKQGEARASYWMRVVYWHVRSISRVEMRTWPFKEGNEYRKEIGAEEKGTRWMQHRRWRREKIGNIGVQEFWRPVSQPYFVVSGFLGPTVKPGLGHSPNLVLIWPFVVENRSPFLKWGMVWGDK